MQEALVPMATLSHTRIGQILLLPSFCVLLASELLFLSVSRLSLDHVVLLTRCATFVDLLRDSTPRRVTLTWVR